MQWIIKRLIRNLKQEIFEHYILFGRIVLLIVAGFGIYNIEYDDLWKMDSIAILKATLVSETM
jgi:hypothetical protein